MALQERIVSTAQWAKTRLLRELLNQVVVRV
uniref:Uncharacterized protein n=1 Tax=Anguilla anguilla TaxID=7936 RepID=A0A0E9S039_ANGAN